MDNQYRNNNYTPISQNNQQYSNNNYTPISQNNQQYSNNGYTPTSQKSNAPLITGIIAFVLAILGIVWNLVVIFAVAEADTEIYYEDTYYEDTYYEDDVYFENNFYDEDLEAYVDLANIAFFITLIISAVAFGLSFAGKSSASTGTGIVCIVLGVLIILCALITINLLNIASGILVIVSGATSISNTSKA